MKRLEDAVDLPAMMERFDQARQAFRRAQVEAHGWDQDVTCVFCGDTGTMPGTGTFCSCSAGEFAKDRKRADDRWRAHIPRHMQEWRRGGVRDREALHHVEAWVNEATTVPEYGDSLIIEGPVGSGKTGLAIVALRVVAAVGMSFQFVNAAEMIEALRPRGKDDPDTMTMRLLQRTGVLCLDDLGAERATDFVAEQLYVLLNYRMNEGKPTIVTTNLPERRITELYGPRVVRRLYQDYRAVEVTVT